MCRKETVRVGVIVFTIALGELASFAQTSADWRKVGGAAVELALAAPATGAVDQVWYSPQGSVLFARTRSGRVFQTADFETWLPAESGEAPSPNFSPAARLPEDGARVIAAGNPGRIYGLGRQLFRSDDGGRTWENLTAYKTNPIIGTGQHSLAVSPADPDQLVVANDFGVWRSMDGGMSWTGLNQFLPNLAVRRILSTPSGTGGTRVAVEGLGAIELPPGGVVWQTVPNIPADPDTALKQRFGAAIRNLTAVAQAGRFVYAGTADGRILISLDEGLTFNPTQVPARAVGPVTRLWVDPSGTALAVMGGRGARILRNAYGNQLWDELDGNLPDGNVYGIAAERAAGAVYVATDRGVFFGRADLMNASTPSVSWTHLSAKLPPAPATDVRLDPAGVQLYAALDGYGVYAASAPHRARNLRIVNGGDFTARAAAPGSLLSIVGGRVDAATGAGLNYPVLAGSDSESQIQVPFEAAGPSVALALRTADGVVMRDLPVQRVSPAIMVSRDGAPMLYDADSGMPLDLRNAARSNGRLHIWATGLGRVSPNFPTGMAAPLENPPQVVAQVRAFLDGNPLQVVKSSLLPGYVGFYLIEVQLPPIVNAGSSELYVSADGQESNRVQVWIEP